MSNNLYFSRMLKSSDLLYEAAAKYFKEGDEELAFISFMKYFQLIQQLLKQPIPKAELEFIKIRSKTQMNQSIEKCESLKKSLDRR